MLVCALLCVWVCWVLATATVCILAGPHFLCFDLSWISNIIYNTTDSELFVEMIQAWRQSTFTAYTDIYRRLSVLKCLLKALCLYSILLVLFLSVGLIKCFWCICSILLVGLFFLYILLCFALDCIPLSSLCYASEWRHLVFIFLLILIVNVSCLQCIDLFI